LKGVLGCWATANVAASVDRSHRLLAAAFIETSTLPESNLIQDGIAGARNQSALNFSCSEALSSKNLACQEIS
jgi:hypothetical protein